MLDELRGMAFFAKTVEVGSFRGAAKALGLSASVVSHHVAQLETRLDVVLLYRSTRRFKLTAAGETLFTAAKAMMEAAEEGLGEIAQTSKTPSGRLVIAAPAGLIRGRLIGDLAAFAKAHPKIKLTVRFSDVPVDIIGAGVDVALRAGSLQASALKSKKLFELPRRLVASPAYHATKPKPHHPRDLAAWDWIKLESRPPRVEFFGPGREQAVVEITPRLIVDTGDAMLELARNDLGLATPPLEMVERDLELGHIVEVLPRWRLATPNVYAVWPANAPRSGLSSRFVAFLESRHARSPSAARPR